MSGEIECPECGAATPASDQFCGGCGLKLPRVARKAAQPEYKAPNRARRREDSRFVGRSQSTLSAIRGLYGLLALMSGMFAVVAWGGYLDIDDRSAVDFVAVALLTMVAGVNIAGFVLFEGNPFLWTVVLAALQTLSLALKFMSTEHWHGIAIAVAGLQGLLVVALWAAVPVAARFTKIQRDRAAEARRGGRSASLSARAAGREVRDHRQATRTFAFAAGAVAVLAFLAAWLPYRASAARRVENAERAARAERDWREQSAKRAADKRRREAERDANAGELESTAGTFRAAWGGSNLEKLKDHFEAERQVTFWPKVEKLFERRGWSQKLPALGKPEITDQGEDYIEVVYPVENELLKTRWSWIDGRWRIIRFVLADI